MWLQQASAEAGEKANHVLQISAAQKNILIYEQALGWFTDGGKKPSLVQAMHKPLKQNHAHGRLSQSWCVIQHARGVLKSDAQKAFLKDIWPTLRGSQDVKNHNTSDLPSQAFTERLEKLWIEGGVQSCTQFLALPQVQGAVMLPGPAPTPAMPSLDDEVPIVTPVHVLHPGYDADNTDGILAYLDGIVNTKVQAMKEYEETQTYDEILQKALAWADTPEGIGQLRVQFRCGESRRKLNNALAQTQAELVELHRAEDLHGVWCTDKRGRPPMQRAELETEVDVDALKLAQGVGGT